MHALNAVLYLMMITERKIPWMMFDGRWPNKTMIIMDNEQIHDTRYGILDLGRAAFFSKICDVDGPKSPKRVYPANPDDISGTCTDGQVPVMCRAEMTTILVLTCRYTERPGFWNSEGRADQLIHPTSTSMTRHDMRHQQVMSPDVKHVKILKLQMIQSSFIHTVQIHSLIMIQF